MSNQIAVKQEITLILSSLKQAIRFSTSSNTAKNIKNVIGVNFSLIPVVLGCLKQAVSSKSNILDKNVIGQILFKRTSNQPLFRVRG